jgi:hypothetical protein
MATITPTVSIVQIMPGNFQYTHTWSNMQFGDVGAPVSIGDIIKSLDCLLDPDAGGLAWEASSDGASFTEVPVIGVTDPLFHWPTYVRPHVVLASATSITATLQVSRTYK